MACISLWSLVSTWGRTKVLPLRCDAPWTTRCAVDHIVSYKTKVI